MKGQLSILSGKISRQQVSPSPVNKVMNLALLGGDERQAGVVRMHFYSASFSVDFVLKCGFRQSGS